MRFYEFAPIKYLRTPAVSNVPAEPITQVRNVPVIPEPVKRQRVQQQLAAQVAHNQNQVKPTVHDLEMAWMMYGQAQSDANREMEKQRAEQELQRRRAGRTGKSKAGKRS